MSGTKKGGKKLKKTILERYGKDYYINLGSIGGKAKHRVRGFEAMTPEERAEYGRKGGRISRRGKKVLD